MYLEVTCFMIAGERQTNRLRAMYLAAALRQDIAFFDTAATTGEITRGRMAAVSIAMRRVDVVAFSDTSATTVPGQ